MSRVVNVRIACADVHTVHHRQDTNTRHPACNTALCCWHKREKGWCLTLKAGTL